MIRSWREPKSITRAVSSSTPMTRPRPYLSWVTWSWTAKWATGGAAGEALKGLVGRKRRVAARAGFIMTSMRLHHDQNAPADRPLLDPPAPPGCRRTAACARRIVWRDFAGDRRRQQPDHGSPTTRNARSAANECVGNTLDGAVGHVWSARFDGTLDASGWQKIALALLLMSSGNSCWHEQLPEVRIFRRRVLAGLGWRVAGAHD